MSERYLSLRTKLQKRYTFVLPKFSISKVNFISSIKMMIFSFGINMMEKIGVSPTNSKM